MVVGVSLWFVSLPFLIYTQGSNEELCYPDFNLYLEEVNKTAQSMVRHLFPPCCHWSGKSVSGLRERQRCTPAALIHHMSDEPLCFLCICKGQFLMVAYQGPLQGQETEGSVLEKKTQYFQN